MSEFTPFPKLARLNREVIVTEKIDGTNAAVVVPEDEGQPVYAQSRKRVITPEDDNFGFARFVAERADEFRATLGPGVHFGEWYGSGIQRKYGLSGGERWFALFNVSRWTAGTDDWSPLANLPDHVTAVPVLAVLPTLNGLDVNERLDWLRIKGSQAAGAKGFANPEGLVLFHTAGRVGFKVTLEKDDQPKGVTA